MELFPQDLLRQRVLDLALDGAAQRPRAQLRVVALLGEQQLRLGRELQAETLALELLRHPLDHQVDDLGDLRLAQLVEDDHLVDAVQELGAEAPLELLHHAFLHLLVGDRLARRAEPDRRLAQIGGAEVRRHDDHGVLEVDRAALGVGQAPVLQDLEEGVEDVGVGLLDLVEQHDRERLAAHGLGELAALLVADVARGRAHQTRHRVLLHVLGHVELDEMVLVAEQELGEGLGQLGLPDTRRAQEDERTAGALGGLEARQPSGDASP